MKKLELKNVKGSYDYEKHSEIQAASGEKRSGCPSADQRSQPLLCQ